MTEIFIVLAIVYFAFAGWYVYQSSLCSKIGHDWVECGGTYISGKKGQYGGHYLKEYRCTRCGKRI